MAVVLEDIAATQASKGTLSSFTPRQLSLPGRTLPPALPLIISCHDSWNPDTCKLDSAKEHSQDHSLKVVEDALELLRTIHKPVAVLSICGPYRSGKSYFMSRLLGCPGTFQLGHSMRACTRGIWMATTILECEQFATIVLDTEGIDAIGASETIAMSLLTLTTLLSSFLIYNSKKVPQKVDLDKMRCFSQLSTSLLAQRGDSMTADAMKKFFPHFLWLLRDVSLTITNKEGEKITPTEFLHTRVLASESGERTDLGKSLCSLFPSLKCATLPIPSSKRDVIRKIVEQQDRLNPAFNTAFNELIQNILQQAAPKIAIDGVSSVNGSMLAALACGYVDAINAPGALPDLEQGWQAVIRLQLKEYSDKLVREYEREMEESLKGNLPMEERNLMRIHLQTLDTKWRSLQEENYRINPLNSSTEDVEPLLSQLEQEIMKWSEPADDEGERKVVGGVVFQFVSRNFTESKKHCEELFTKLLMQSKVQDKYSEAIQTSEPLEISAEIEAITEDYHKRAVGPAAREVLEKGLSELNQLRDTLKMIPGSPQRVRVVGTGSDRIKLSWKPPEINPQAVEVYVVWKRAEGGTWEEVKRTKKTKALIVGLKSHKKYEFRVLATNSLMMSLATSKGWETEYSKAAIGGMVVGAGIHFSPLLVGIELKDKVSDPSTIKTVGIFAATIPLSILMAPIVVPAVIGYCALGMKEDLDEQNLSPVSDDEN